MSAPARDDAPRRPKSANAAQNAAKAAKAGRRRFLPRTLGAYLGLALGAALIGVVANALLLQHGRRAVPLFGGESAPAHAADPPQAQPAPAPVRADAAAKPAAKPQELPPPLAPSRKGDAIGDLLRSAGGSGADKEVYAAQRALKKLGYDLEPDGVMGAGTERALRDFEKAHGLPLTSDVTPRLMARLNAAAR